MLGGVSRSETSFPIDLAAGTAVTAINITRSMITRARTYAARCQFFSICVWKKGERKGGSKRCGGGGGVVRWKKEEMRDRRILKMDTE